MKTVVRGGIVVVMVAPVQSWQWEQWWQLLVVVVVVVAVAVAVSVVVLVVPVVVVARVVANKETSLNPKP